MEVSEKEKIEIGRRQKIRELLPKSERIDVGQYKYDVINPAVDKKFSKKFIPVLGMKFMLGPCRFRVVYINDGKFTITAQLEHVFVRRADDLLPEEKLEVARVNADEEEKKLTGKFTEYEKEVYSLKVSDRLIRKVKWFVRLQLGKLNVDVLRRWIFQRSAGQK